MAIKTHPVYYPMYEDKEHFIILITGGRGCEDPDTEIMMADLTIKKIKDIKVGEQVMGDDGTPRNVVSVVRGRSMMYRVHQTNAEDYIVNDTHILSVVKKPSAMTACKKCPNGRYPQYDKYSDIPIGEYMATSNRFKNNFLGYKSGSVPCKEQEVKIEPYMLGVWLGDGTSIYPCITNPDKEIVDYLYQYAKRVDVDIRVSHKECTAPMYRLTGKKCHENKFLQLLRDYDLIDNKHIPQEYISNSEEVRLQLLAGLIDTDGYYDKRGDYEITQKNEKMARQIKFIADTLGFRTKLSSKKAKIGTKDCGIVFRINISGDIYRIPCKVERKKASANHYEKRSWRVSRLSFTELGEGDYCGLFLDGNHRYLHADGTVTHNSGKSFSTSNFIERLTFEMNKDEKGNKLIHQVLLTRYTMTSANISVIPEFMEKIELDGTEKYFATRRADIENRMTGSKIMFRGIKTSSGNQTAKLKSIHGITTFVVDEAEEWTSEKEFETIMYSIRQQGIQNRIIIIMNPTDSNHFIYEKYIKDTHKLVEFDGVPVQISTHPNVLHIHTSYLDNIEHLSPQFIKEAQQMKADNPERYAHIFMGQWTDVAEGAVYKKWGIVDEFPEECKKIALGVDFGFTNDFTAIVRCGIIDDRIYVDEVCYKTGMLAKDIADELKNYPREFVYADSADPRLIKEIGNHGILIYSVIKGAGSIEAGIDKIKTMELYVTKRSVNVQEELRNYVWSQDVNGKYTNVPIDQYNHCMDAMRYYVLAQLLGKVNRVIKMKGGLI